MSISHAGALVAQLKLQAARCEVEAWAEDSSKLVRHLRIRVWHNRGHQTLTMWPHG